MENDVSASILAGHRVCPEFLHEKHLIGKLRRDSAIATWPRFADPVGELADEIEKEVVFGYADHFVRDLDEQRKSFR